MPGLTIVVSKNGSRLVAQVTGKGAFEMFPSAETQFFMKGVNAKMTFTKDAAGKVTGLVLHQGGRDLAAKKIK